MSVRTDIALIDNASRIFVSINNEANRLNDTIDNINNTPVKPKDMTETENGFSRIVGSSKSLLGTFSKIGASLYGLKEITNIISNTFGAVTGYSDSITLADTRLKLINNGLESTDGLWNEIYNSSRRARVSMLDTADTVQRIKMNTGDILSNNKEVLKFTENLSKSFKIAGINAQGISTSMLQLTQSLSSGVLQGDEFKSLKENAPNIINLISDYMGVTRGELEELSSQGKITANIVKNSILGATDEINQKFEEMPMTWEELSIQYKNIWDNNMLMLRDEMSGLPQVIADNTLDIWDGISYGFSSTLNSMDKQQSVFLQGVKKGNENMYSELSKALSKYSGETINELDAMKISFAVFFEYIESSVQRGINYFIQVCKLGLGAIAIVAEVTVSNITKGIDLIAERIDKITGGMTDLSKTTGKWVDGITESISKTEQWMFTFENVAGDDYFGSKNILKDIVTDKVEEYINIKDTKKDTIELDKDNSLDIPRKPYKLDGIARDVSDISKGISNLNDINKAIMEINEATYHNNIANQFTGNIQVISYATGEEEQKAIGKVTEDAVRKVIFNDYQNTQAMGVYA